MTYYPDLSRYEYGSAQDGAEPVLNVGWLSSAHSYPTRVPDDLLVNALLICCLRPVELYRGFHTCDLVDEDSNDYEMHVHEYDGREILLGNGEVRVTGSDGQHYAAPTLVAHYVAAHQYVPPAAFQEGVMRRAREIHVLHGEALKRVRMLSMMERFALCLDCLRALHAQRPERWVADAITALEAAKPALEPEVFANYRTELARMTSAVLDTPRDAAAAGDPIAAAVRPMSQFFVYARHGDDRSRKATLRLAASVLELAHEAGLKHWRSDMRPSRLDESL